MDSVSNMILAIGLMLVMWGMGLSLVTDDFKRVVRYPKAVVIGLICQLILIPLVGYILAISFGVRPEIAVGIMVLAACPGGPTSNLISHLSRADVALSVSLTAISSLITVFTIPLIVNFALMQFMDRTEVIRLNFIDSIIQISTVVVIPVALGMMVRRFYPKLAFRLNKPVKIASGVILMIIILGVILKEKDVLPGYFAETGLIALTLNVSMILIGFFISRLFKLSLQQATSISIETGIQNGTLALAISGGMLHNTAFSIAPAVYSVIMFLTGFVFIYWGSKRLPRPETELQEMATKAIPS